MLEVRVEQRVCLILLYCVEHYISARKNQVFHESPNNFMTFPYFRDISVRGIKRRPWYGTVRYGTFTLYHACSRGTTTDSFIEK